MKHNFCFALILMAALVNPVLSAEIPANIQTLFTKYCLDCHSTQDRESPVQLEVLSSLKQAPLIDVLDKVESQLFFEMMPPKDSPQFTPAEKQMLFTWVQSELRQHQASGLDAKARSPEAGNWVDHNSLFAGNLQYKPYSPARRWLITPQIFQQRVFDVFEMDARAREGNKHGLKGITNPITLPEHSGIRDYDLATLNGSHLLTMLGNAEWISKKQIRSARVKNGELKADEYENKSDKFSPPTPSTFEVIILKKSVPTDAEIQSAIVTQFERVLRRQPNADELKKYSDLTSAAIQIAGNTEGLRQRTSPVRASRRFAPASSKRS
jgi:hypothetical protein